jgi:hypothetical protein
LQIPLLIVTPIIPLELTITGVADYNKIVHHLPELYDAPSKWQTDEYFSKARILGPNAPKLEVVTGNNQSSNFLFTSARK